MIGTGIFFEVISKGCVELLWNLSGRNCSGSSQSSGSMWVAMKLAAMPVPWKISKIDNDDNVDLAIRDTDIFTFGKV